MAKEASGKGAGEKILNIPLRREWIKAPRNERGKRALFALRGFVSKHMKSYDIKISQRVNEKIWTRGIQKPPQDIRVKISRDSKGIIQVMLPEEIAKRPEKEAKKGRLEKMKETLEKEKGLPGMAGPKEEILKKGKKKGTEEAKEKEEEKPKEEPKKEEAKPEKETKK